MKIYSLLILIAFFFSCKYDKVEPVAKHGYPADVAKILVNKCATEGCHNTVSRITSAGLDFSTWELMFDGGRNGTSVIPYSVDYSFMLYTVNTDPNRAPVLLPTMPYLQPQLSESEYQTLVNWIANGAPDKNGFVKFSDDPERKKVYICMQGCDMVAVLDAKTKIIMRYIKVGNNPGMIESPHQVRISPDGQFWYVVFYSGNILQKFRTSDDVLVSTLDIGFATWNTLVFTHDGKTGFINALDNVTQIVDLSTMTKGITLNQFTSPHGGFVSPDQNFLYLTCQNGNFIYKVELTSGFYQEEKITIVPGQQPVNSAPYQPHEIQISPDSTKYFISCQGTNEIRVFQLSNDSLIKIIPVGVKPQELAVSLTRPYLFVTCTEDPINSNKKGNVYVINYNTLALHGSPIYTGFQPHGIAVDDEEDLVYVANLNADPNAPAPHHQTSCSGRNGNLTIINMATLQLYNKTLADGNSFQYKNELLPSPYFVSIKK